MHGISILAVMLAALPLHAGQVVLREWKFDGDGPDGWRPGRHLDAVTVENGEHVEEFCLSGDGVRHTYRIDVGTSPQWEGHLIYLAVRITCRNGAHPRWRGLLRNLRIDPCRGSERRVRIESIRLIPEPLSGVSGTGPPGSCCPAGRAVMSSRTSREDLHSGTGPPGSCCPAGRAVMT